MAKREYRRRQKARYPSKHKCKGNGRTKPNNSPAGGSSTTATVRLLTSHTPPPITSDSYHHVSSSAREVMSTKGSRSQVVLIITIYLLDTDIL